MSFILSQKIPFGGFVCTKNIPVDHLSSRKLQVPSFVFTLFTRVRGHYAALTYNCSEDLKDSWENAMNKLAIDAVHKIFDGMKEEGNVKVLCKPDKQCKDYII